MGVAIASPYFGGSKKVQSLISAYLSLAITTHTPRFKKLSMALLLDQNLDELVNELFRI